MPPQFKKVLKRKERRLQEAVSDCIVRLTADVTYPGLRVHKMRGVKDVWEAYVDASNRVTFHWEDGIIVLRNNCNHAILERDP